MGLLTALLPERRATVGAQTATVSESAGWLESLLGGGVSTAGRRVNAQSAMTVSAVYAGIRLLGSSVGQLPLAILKKDADGARTEMRSHRLWTLLNNAPNGYLTALEYRELMTSWALLHGNAVSYLELGPGGSIESILPIDPDRIRFWLTPDRTQVVYEYLRPNGGSTFIPRDQVFHLRGPLGNAYIGTGLLALARDAIGLGMVAEEHASRFYSNAAQPAGVLQTPKALKADTFKKIREQWNARYQGTENAFKTAILEDGVEWKPVALNLKDQQFLETRTFQVQEIARWIGVPPHLIGELTRSTNNNIEAQGIEFIQFAIGPWCVRWEQRIWLDCLGENERKTVYAKHNVNAFVRGQLVSRYQAYQIGRMGGWLSQNDVRRSEDMDPIGPEGDVYMAPLNMVPAASFGDPTDAPGDTPPGAPPTMNGGTRSAQVDAATRNAAQFLTPLMLEAAGRCHRRAAREWQQFERRTATPTDADALQHRQFCAQLVQPIADAYAVAVALSIGADHEPRTTRAIVESATTLVVHDWAAQFRASPVRETDSAGDATRAGAALSAIGQAIHAWATSLPEPEPAA
jgi:HK97 family phage portal protein